MRIRTFVASVKYLLYFIGFLWLVFFIGLFIPVDSFGILPRKISGLPGIIFSPFIHGSVSHLTANTAALLLITGFLIFLEGGKTFFIMSATALLGGAGTWIIGRGGSYHIGASGIIYGILGYLLSAGIFRRDFKSIAVSITVFLVYGGLVFGVLPADSFVSWESHLCGFMAGIVAASFNRRKV